MKLFSLARPFAFCFVAFVGQLNLPAQFTPGHLVVLQAGDGTSALANTGNRIVLREFSPAGVPAYSVALSATNAPLVIGGSATSEGLLSLSADGRLLVFAGYATNPPFASPLSGATAAALNRAVGVVNLAGTYSRVATSASFFSTANIRGAASDGNGNFWGSGASGGGSGTAYFGTNAPQGVIQNSITNTRAIAVFNGNLYFSTAAGTPGVVQVGNGYPLSTGQTTSLVISAAGTGSGTASPYAFWFNSTQTVCYVADDRSAANGGGIQKWVLNNGSWSLLYTLAVGAGAGARGVVASQVGTVTTVYATTDETSGNRFVSIHDGGALSSATTLATAAANTAFRGLSFAPYCAAPEITSFFTANACPGQVYTLTPGISGTAPLSYSWAASTSFTAQGASALGAGAGVFSLSVSNACGSSSAAINVTLHPQPALTFSPLPGIVCPGGTGSVTASGAASYTWSNGQVAPTLTATPSNTSFYTVTATSADGCVATRSIAILVTPSLQVNAAPLSVCPGSVGLLTGAGAHSFTWHPGGLVGQTATVAATALVYTVTGWAPGCTSTASTTVQVSVAQQPTVTVGSVTLCAGKTATLAAYGANSYLWSIPDSGPLVFVTPTVTSVYTVTGLSAEGCLGTTQASVTVFPTPTVALSAPSATFCTNGAPALLTASPPGGFFEGAGVNSNQFIPALAGEGSFTVGYTYMSAAGCSASSSITLQVLVCLSADLQPQTARGALRVYPVPAGNTLQLYDAAFTHPWRLDLYSADGKWLQHIPVLEPYTAVPIHHLPAGLYVLAGANGLVRFVKD